VTKLNVKVFYTVVRELRNMYEVGVTSLTCSILVPLLFTLTV